MERISNPKPFSIITKESFHLSVDYYALIESLPASTYTGGDKFVPPLLTIEK